MENHISEVLERLGWTDGFRVPIANEENRILEAKVAEKANLRAEIDKKLTQVTKRLSYLQKHLERSSKEQVETQHLLAAHRNQLNAEQDLFKLAELEEEAVKREIQQVKKKKTEVENKNTKMKDDLAKLTEKLEYLKESVSWNKEALREWEEYLVRGEEANDAIKRYSAQDAANFHDLDMKRQKLRTEMEFHRQRATQKSNDLACFEQQLERMGIMYREAHNERQKLVQQWRDSVAQLQLRDSQIEIDGENIEKLEEEERTIEEEVNEAKLFYENQLLANKALNAELTHLNNKLGRTRENLPQLQQLLLLRKSEVPVEKNLLHRLAASLEQRRADNKNVILNIEEKRKKVEQWEETKEEIGRKYKDVLNKCSSASERTKDLEKMLDGEENIIKNQSKEIHRMQMQFYRGEQVHSKVKKEAEFYEGEIKGIEGSFVLFRRQEVKIDHDLQRSREILYNLDYRTQELEAQLAKLTGTSTDEDNAPLEEKLTQLEKIFAEKTETNNILQDQISKIENDMRIISKHIQRDSIEETRLKNEMEETTLAIDKGTAMLKSWSLRNNEIQVEENVLKLKVAQVERGLAMEGDRLFNFEKHRLEMEAALKERQIEIQVQGEMLTAAKRSLMDEKSKLKMDIAERELKIKKYRSKYEVIASSLGKGEDGSDLGVTQLRIKAAQEKFAVQMEGDRLDNSLKISEQDIRALENTLRVLNQSNATFKKSLCSVEDDGPEITKLKDLQNLYLELNQQLIKAQSKRDECIQMTKNLTQTLADLQEVQEAANITRTSKLEEMTVLNRDLMDQKFKLERADNAIKKAIIEAKNRLAEPELMHVYEVDILSRELKDQNESALIQLSQMAQDIPTIAQTISKRLEERNLKLATPSVTRLLVSKRTSFTEKSQKSEGSVCSSVSTFYMTRDMPGGSATGFSDYGPKGSSTSLHGKSTSSSKARGSEQQESLTPNIIEIGFDAESIRPASTRSTESKQSKSSSSSINSVRGSKGSKGGIAVPRLRKKSTSSCTLYSGKLEFPKK